jgi:hypothetical protein
MWNIKIDEVTMMQKQGIVAGLSILLLFLNCQKSQVTPLTLEKTVDNGQWIMLTPSDLTESAQHTQHALLFGKYVEGYNDFVLKAIDLVQATAMDGGGYFTGKDSIPTESPIGYPLQIFNRSLINPPRTTSYCSGSTYAIFIEAMNMILKDKASALDDVHYEALRMQEPDGGRREDGIKFWGHWNADGFGNHFALVQYSGIGEVLDPQNAQPGDFMNISWKSGYGHSVVFLGWYENSQGEKSVVYWSSQRGTNGMGDQVVSLKRIEDVKIVRIANPDQIFTFDINHPVNISVTGDPVTL